MAAKRVLLVDDEDDILESLQGLLEVAIDEVEIITAADASIALEKLTEAVDLVISDYKMPGMNGLEFLKEVRAKFPDVPRILMTAFPDLKIAMEAINEAGIETFFTKPLEPKEVIDVVEAVTSRRQQDILRSQAFARAMQKAKLGESGGPE